MRNAFSRSSKINNYDVYIMRQFIFAWCLPFVPCILFVFHINISKYASVENVNQIQARKEKQELQNETINILMALRHGVISYTSFGTIY